MKKRKIITSLVLGIALVSGLTACGGSKADNTAGSTNSTNPVTPVSATG